MDRMIAAALVICPLVIITPLRAQAADAGSVTQQSDDQWRASKLAGVPIYGPKDTNVGKISDVLMGRDGKAEYVIVGVGGFLGIGEKDVAIPFGQVTFTDQPLVPPPNPAPGAATLAPDTNNLAVPAATPGGPGTNTGMAAATTAHPAMPAAATTATQPSPMPRSRAVPDHGTIDMTADQLKAAPGFKFAS